MKAECCRLTSDDLNLPWDVEWNTSGYVYIVDSKGKTIANIWGVSPKSRATVDDRIAHRLRMAEAIIAAVKAAGDLPVLRELLDACRLLTEAHWVLQRGFADEPPFTDEQIAADAQAQCDIEDATRAIAAIVARLDG